MNSKVNFYFEKESKFQTEMQELRKIALKSGLNEEIKWCCPCYTLYGKNVFLIHSFKEYCAILFFKGSLIKDQENILVIQSENVQASRQIRFTNLKEIKNLEKTIENYFIEAIEIEKSGEKISFKKTEQFKMPEELSLIFKNDFDLKVAFGNLTPGRQRAYLLFFGSAKQSKTRQERILKNKDKIMNGKGLND